LRGSRPNLLSFLPVVARVRHPDKLDFFEAWLSVIAGRPRLPARLPFSTPFN